MLQKYLLLVLAVAGCLCGRAQVKSPEEFLGYKTGSRFTPHHKIVDYFQHVALQAPSMVKLEQYGETNEGRPLLLAYVSSAANIRNLETIRMNNLRIARVANDRIAAVEENAPAIVWLSYNVHGNEPSSSEAALMTLYALTGPSNMQTSTWLKNTVVIIDPCLNPDGRDRYVNWYNATVGKKYNPNPLAREHREPWPSGRTNHYNFDLNRDWAWQTQIESRQRIQKYLQWMPHIHVDYHEQGINEPYYFAPASEPYHEVITGWQREFQKTIGKNNAAYFDKKGWLYFTGLRFDLFYPSYGDTYPTFNGAIGMTYEQGGISGGLGVLNEDGDTLTLEDRAMHHYTTSLSTIEVASMHAAKLVKEFGRYFSSAVSNGVGEYKTYIIKNHAADEQRLAKLLELLDKNGISYSAAAGATARGYNYHTGREETFTVGSNDVMISAFQPRSAMVKVLFEPRSKLSDSATYDITAWSLPYAYGLSAFACKEKLVAGGAVVKPVVTNTSTDYAYVMPWNGVRTVKAAGKMMKRGILLRFSESPFEVNGKKFERGAILILKTSNQKFGNELWNIARQIANENDIQLYPVSTGYVDKGFDFGSSKVRPLKPPKVVLITGDAINTTAAGSIWNFFEQELDYPVTQINASDVQRINWHDVDVVILPDGNHRYLNDKDVAENFKTWIRKGGRVVALESAVAQMAKAEIAFKAKKADEDERKEKGKSDYDALNRYEDRERDALSGMTAGAIYKIELDNTHPLAFGYPDYYYALKQDDYLYEFLEEEGWNVGVIKKNNQVAGFVGAGLKNKLKDGLLYGVKQVGNGTVTCLSDDVIFRNFWENGKLMLCNAVFLVGQ